MGKLTRTGNKGWTIVACAAVALLFVLSQVVISAHAAKYGDSPHEHGGQTCVLSLVSPGGDKFVTSAAVALAVVFFFWRVSNHIAQTERARIAVRAARPRGPPNR